MDEGNRKCVYMYVHVCCVCVAASEWVGAEKEVAEEKVEVKSKRQKATDERKGQRAVTRTAKRRRRRVRPD